MQVDERYNQKLGSIKDIKREHWEKFTIEMESVFYGYQIWKILIRKMYRVLRAVKNRKLSGEEDKSNTTCREINISRVFNNNI